MSQRRATSRNISVEDWGEENFEERQHMIRRRVQEIQDRLERPLPGNSSYDLSRIPPQTLDDCEEYEWDEEEERFDEDMHYFNTVDESDWDYERMLALDEKIVKKDGLPLQTLRTFERLKPQHPDVAGKQCPICLEKFAGAGSAQVWVRRLPCHHDFHDDCLRIWFLSSHACPMCRFDCRCA